MQTSASGSGAVSSVDEQVFPAIDDYAFLSDCETSCLIAPSGAVEWMCLPRPDSPSVFGALLDRGAGHFRLGPYGVAVPAARQYVPGGMVLETTWQTETGWLVVRDALVVGPWHDTAARSHTYRRTPRDLDAEHALVRVVECVNGVVELELSCAPAFDYDRAPATWTYTGAVYEQATATGADGDGPALTLTTDLKLGLDGRLASARTRMVEGDRAFVALSWSELPPPRTFDEAERKLHATNDFWRQWLTLGEFPDHPWRRYLQRSALALKGLTYAPTGALLAAATTSLPESPGGERNWDYRYSWVRDSSFALWGLYTLGFNREADDFFAFLHDVAIGVDGNPLPLQVLYGIGGEREITESELPNLHGYGGARPVRVGNAAYDQVQHDVWGVILDSVYIHVKSRNEVPEALWPMLRTQVESAIAQWHEPDRGIWEIRGEPQHFTCSKVMCWVALDRGARLADLHGQHEHAEQWRRIAAEIHADVLAHGVNSDGVFTQTYGGTALDASLLLVPLMRFLPPEDPRVRATVLAIADHLTVDGLVLRYRTDTTDDGLSGVEGAFTICSFWLVSALVEIDELTRARELCHRLLGYASDLQLYAEEIDPRTGRHLGNFPQAFTHLALINAVTHVIRAEQSTSGLDAGRFRSAHA
ncbi:glycoside hydrolase family 15 protein [Nocardia sp. JMUB6875]